MLHTTITSNGCACAGCSYKAHAAEKYSKSADITKSHHTNDAQPYYVEAVSSSNVWGKAVVTYTFGSSSGHFEDRNASNYNTFNQAQQQATREALAEFAKIANISFREVVTSEPAKADMVFRQADMPDNLAGWAFEPSDQLGTDITIDTTYNGRHTGRMAEYYGLEQGQFGFRLLLHEIGHAMGLMHPFEGSTTLPEREDSQNATVMSYNGADENIPAGDYVGGNVASRVGPFAPQTLMMYDIAALQSIYGANTSYNADNTRYSFDGQAKVFTLWDGNGTDLLDGSSFNGAVHFDLREGLEYVSRAGETSFWHAFGANIENAEGSTGNDTITGNALGNNLAGNGGADSLNGNEGADTINGNQGNDSVIGGNGDDRLMGGKEADTLYGGEGNDWVNGNNDQDIIYAEAGNDYLRGGKENDIMLGGSGNDTLWGDLGNDLMAGGEGADIFAFAARSGGDIITDFEIGVDKLLLEGLGLDAAGVMSLLSTSGSNALLQLSANDSVTLQGIDASQLTSTDFMFG